MVDANATRACVVCGALFPRDHKRIICSDHCKVERLNAQMRERRARRAPLRACAHCCKEFKGRAGKVYCGSECKARHDAKARRRGTSNAQCKTCGSAFIKANGTQTYCCVACARRDRSAEYERARKRRASARTLRDRVELAMKAVAVIAGLDAARQRKIRSLVRNADRPMAGMTDASRWRRRYNNNHTFRQKEIQRLKTAKLKRKKRQGHSLSKDEALAIYAERSSCLYCGRALGHSEKVLDHMDPLSKGGAHDASNLVVSCADCNTRKASKEFVKWLPLVADGRRKLVADWYKRKHGAQPEQASLLLLMAA